MGTFFREILHIAPQLSSNIYPKKKPKCECRTKNSHTMRTQYRKEIARYFYHCCLQLLLWKFMGIFSQREINTMLKLSSINVVHMENAKSKGKKKNSFDFLSFICNTFYRFCICLFIRIVILLKICWSIADSRLGLCLLSQLNGNTSFKTIWKTFSEWNFFFKLIKLKIHRWPFP